ncbi:S41 family peptidase [Chitinophaga oryzae]|uniref:S41 family peptidase n=1 Tax=Chitinophaga oryzae TaxID=2725414 RepID=A0AAE6ZJM8_9BACT|nr:S41 family peptidase [Chitinophaga oryzae]QJB32614.1 S41 family peptidase [Chitinophaga oryzae]QJB39066.1 S41 family peptidase [Chitinophaga oryzae]
MKKWYSLMAACLCLSTVYGQTVTSAEKQAIIRQSAQLLEQHYVYPDKGKVLAAALLQKEKELSKGTDSVDAFAKSVTSLLRQTVKDGHVYLRFDPEIVPKLKVPRQRMDSAQDPFHYGERAARMNYGFMEVKVLPGTVGYIRLSEINFSPKSVDLLKAAMTLVQHTQALILDLRDNGGGGSAIGLVLEGYFVKAGTPLLEVKNRKGDSEVMKAEALSGTQPYERPLYILVNKKTASAAEALAFELQHLKRAMVVGERTAGGAHMNELFPVGDRFCLSVSCAAPVFPGTDHSWELTGIQPDIVTTNREEDLPVVLGLIKKDHDTAGK